MQQYGEQPVPPPTRPLPDLPDEPIPMPPPGDPPTDGMPHLDDVALLKSEHTQLRGLANVMVGTHGFEGFEGLSGQLSGMIRDHLGSERPLLELAVPHDHDTDDPLAVAALRRLANDLDSRLDSIDPNAVLTLLEDHIRLVEEHVLG